jgi:hypothetical protein
MNVLFLIIKYKPIEYAYTLIYVLWTGLSLSLIVFSDVSGFGNPVLPIYSSSLDDVNSKDVY